MSCRACRELKWHAHSACGIEDRARYVCAALERPHVFTSLGSLSRILPWENKCYRLLKPHPRRRPKQRVHRHHSTRGGQPAPRYTCSESLHTYSMGSLMHVELFRPADNVGRTDIFFAIAQQLNARASISTGDHSLYENKTAHSKTASSSDTPGGNKKNWKQRVELCEIVHVKLSREIADNTARILHTFPYLSSSLQRK